MRALTSGEAAVVRSVLASEPVSERERIRRSGVPPRTFERARQRAYAEGWVFDRYVPDPMRIRRPYVTFALAQPVVERFQEVQDQWTNDPSCVVLWKWQETIFGVFISEENGTGARHRALAPALFRRNFEVTANARGPHIPVFFDFEGAWSRIADLQGVQAYPHSLPQQSWNEKNTPILSEADERGAADLVRRPMKREGANGPLRVSPFFFPRSQQRLLRMGVIERRVFLDLAKIPPCHDRVIERLAFIQGEFLSGSSPAALFRRLATIRVLPFLFATDGSRVLLGTLSPAPPTPTKADMKPAVLANLQRFLRSIDIVRERVASLSVVVNHRYDRLFAIQPVS